MPKVFISLFALLMVAIATPALFGAGGQSSVHPVDLRCEYRKNPLAVDSLAPRLSWTLAATDPAARGLSQSAYQILAASSEARLTSNQGDLWDSGKMNSDRSILYIRA